MSLFLLFRLHGTPFLKTRLRELDKAFVQRNPGSKPGTHIRISVSDTGSGMSEEVKERVFEPFFTTKEVGKGTGLGLSTVYGIVKQNEGSVYVESQPGKGTTIRVNWPVNDELLEKEAEIETEQKDYSGSERILLVEDDNGVRNFAASTLSSFGYRVTEARNGEEAVRLVSDKKIKKPFHLMVTDLIMPRMNGQDLAERIKDIIKPGNILYVSGYTYEYLQKDSVLKEGIHFLQKPYSVVGLLKAVRRILDREEQ